MAKQSSVAGRTIEAEPTMPDADLAEAPPIGGGFDQLAEELRRASNEIRALRQDFASFASGQGGAQGSGGQAGYGGADSGPGASVQVQISIWEDDPFSEATPTTNPRNPAPIVVNAPSNANPRLQTSIVEPRPAPARYNPGTANFRYWVAAEALARGINFWGSILPIGTTWSTSNPMSVTLVAGVDLNAFYSRNQGLKFFHQVVKNSDVFSGESSDVVCHELGHAILDGLRPQLFSVASTEAGAFHESFGDMSAILCALQLGSLRSKVLAETGGRLNVNSRLSRLAEQLGWAIRQISSTAVDRDCLRNAANRFFYQRPDTLPPSAPATRLSSEVHSFSRVFTGAFLDALARMFRIFGPPSDAALIAVSRNIAQLLVDAVRAAPITPAYFSQIAAAMIQADQARNGGRNRAALTSAFVAHGILSVPAALALTDAPVPQAASVQPGALAMVGGNIGGGSPIAYTYGSETEDTAYQLGFGETPELPLRTLRIGEEEFDFHAADESPFFPVRPAAPSNVPSEEMSTDDDGRHFIEDLFQQGRVRVDARAGAMVDLSTPDSARVTHVLTTDGSGRKVLKRSHFDCRFCQVGLAAI